MKRLPPIAVGLLLFVSGWGQTLAAAFCPHARGGHACCLANRTSHKHGHTSHHEAAPTGGMGGTEASPPSSGTNAGGDVTSLGQPSEECGHCMSHSRQPAAPLAAGAAGQPKPGADSTAPPPAAFADAQAAVFTPAITSRQHAPPGASSPRHVLISVFRI
jgi:hypothetical protein